jgi:hypothetical protein
LSFWVIASPVPAQEKVVKLRYSIFFPPVHPIAKLGEEWCKEIEKRTSGRVTFSYFPGNTLTPPTQTYDSVVKGIADVGSSLMAYSPGRFPLTGVFGLPLGFTSGYQATKTLNEFYKKFQPKEYADTRVMYFHGHGPGLVSTKKVLNAIDDIKGLRIKVNAENAASGKLMPQCGRPNGSLAMRRASVPTHRKVNKAMPQSAQPTIGGAPNCSADRPTTAGGAMKMKVAGSSRSAHIPCSAIRTSSSSVITGQNSNPTPNCAAAHSV